MEKLVSATRRLQFVETDTPGIDSTRPCHGLARKPAVARLVAAAGVILLIAACGGGADIAADPIRKDIGAFAG
jgi:hypothetical protein